MLRKPTRQFDVRLQVKRPDTPRPLPEKPRPLNPFMPVSDIAMAQWKREVARLQVSPMQGKVLIDKTLTVTGEREFRKKFWPVRLVQWAIKWGTLTLVRPNPWKLTVPQRIASLPLRYEYAYGGQNRIDAGDKWVKRVPKRHRLTIEQRVAHPDKDAPPVRQAVAHDVCEPNPLGLGYAQPWWIKTAKIKAIPAPQIANAGHLPTAGLFWQALRGRLKPGKPQHAKPFEPVGFGIRAKTHPERRALLGTVDEAFIKSDRWLPDDFDFAIWNAAPVDQQTDFLRGDEIIELTNLCAPDTPGAIADAKGNTVLRLAQPGHLPYILVRFKEGSIGELSAQLDTVLIDPEQRQVCCVWRAVVATTPAVRVLEARMVDKADIAAFDTPTAATATVPAPAETTHG